MVSTSIWRVWPITARRVFSAYSVIPRMPRSQAFCPPERSVFPNLDRHIANADGRVIITTFASSIHRVSMILELAMKNGRKVGLLGRSMLNVIAKARELGYMRAPDELFVPIKQINDVPDRETLLLMTGSQGEPLAASKPHLSR